MNRWLFVFPLVATALLGTETAAPDATAARLYKVKCATCHGPNGEGGVGVSLKRKLHHSTAKELHDVIKSGIPGTNMPASGLPDPSVDKLVAYVRYLNKTK